MLTKEKFKEIIEKAVEINNGWKPDWDNDDEEKYFAYCNTDDNELDIDYYNTTTDHFILFETRENAQEFVNSFDSNLLKEFFCLSQVDYLNFINEFESNKDEEILIIKKFLKDLEI